MEFKNKKIIKFGIIFIMILIAIPQSFAVLKLESISFYPNIITAGDNVDINIQFRDLQIGNLNNLHSGNSDYTFKVKILPDDDLTSKYIKILDSNGKNLAGTIYSGQAYSKNFRIKVSPNAPLGSYRFKLEGNWFKNGILEKLTQSSTFFMEVRKEGILLNLASFDTNPVQIRPGDNFVEIKTFIENLGFKNAKSTKITLDLPQGIENSYSNNNEVLIGSLPNGTSRNVSFFINLDKNLKSGLYELNFNFNYLDLDNNNYNKTQKITLLVKPKANLEIEKVIGEGIAGSSSEMRVLIKNIGEEKAENIDVRILKQNSQPFEFNVRSDYIGELQPGEVGEAVFNFKTLSGAKLKSHDFQLIIRALGNSEKGDNNIYIFNKRASFKVTGNAPNYNLWIGSFILLIFVVYILVRGIRKK